MIKEKVKVLVGSINDLYDEKAEALVMNINARHFHPFTTCNWINASLAWMKDNRSINLQSPGIKYKLEGEVFEAFGQGYGGIRFCQKCKTIDCIHYWERETTYQVERNKYQSINHVVGLCRFCKLRILRSSGIELHASQEAWELISEVAISLGKNVPGLNNGYGSGWVCELPVAVSQILDEQGRQAAESYLRSTFRAGDCSGAMAQVSTER